MLKLQDSLLRSVFYLVCTVAMFYTLLTFKPMYDVVIRPYATVSADSSGERVVYSGAFIEPSANNLIQWDAVHYQHIANKGYAHNQEASHGDFIFAFFPLWPWLWSIAQGNPFFGVLMNLMLFVLALLVLNASLKRVNVQLNPNLYLVFPTFICFLLPYTEAVYFLALTIGMYGLTSKIGKIAFIGFLLAAMSRPSYAILLLAVAVSACYFLVLGYPFRRIWAEVKSPILGLVVGTLVVAIFQGFYNGFDWFRFIKVQQYWQTQLQPIRQFSDWSHEGFSMNVPLMLFGLFFTVYFLVRLFIRQSVDQKQEFSAYHLVWAIALFYLLGNVAFVLLFNGGNLHSSFRYIAANPFFLVVLVGSVSILQFGLMQRLSLLISYVSFSVVLFNNLSYTAPWSLNYLGFVLALMAIAYFYLSPYFGHRLRSILYLSMLTINGFWTAFLLNLYLLNSWIFI